MATGPYPPHAALLSRGIDAVTVRAHIANERAALEFYKRTARILAVMSNLTSTCPSRATGSKGVRTTPVSGSTSCPSSCGWCRRLDEG